MGFGLVFWRSCGSAMCGMITTIFAIKFDNVYIMIVLDKSKLLCRGCYWVVIASH